MKTQLPILTIAAALLTLGGCGSRHIAPQWGAVTTDTLMGDRTAAVRISYDFATLTNAAESSALQWIEERNIGYFFCLEEFSGTAAQAADAALRELAEEVPHFLMPESVSDAAQTPYHISVASCGEQLDTLLSYRIDRTNYTGGAHGMHSIEYHTYSLADGRELILDDLFAPAQRARLESMIRHRLYESYDAADDDELAAQGFFPQYIAPTENFRLSAEGITFVYNPYEVGCYALGRVEATIPWSELQPAE